MRRCLRRSGATPRGARRSRRRRRARGRTPTRPRPCGQLLLQPVERAELAAEVVDHVHERRLAGARARPASRARAAVVAEDDVQHGRPPARREARDVLDRAADAVVAERDLAVELAEVGHVDRQRVRRVGVELADVVQQRAGDRDVAVDARERRARSGDRLGDAERVLEQPVPVGLVVALGGRRVAERGPRRRVGAEHARRAARAGAGSGPGRRGRAGRPPSARPCAAGRRAGRRARTRAARRGAASATTSCGP